jgi:hypothetical protein
VPIAVSTYNSSELLIQKNNEYGLNVAIFFIAGRVNALHPYKE